MTHDHEVKVRLEERDYAALAAESKTKGIPIAVIARSWIKESLHRTVAPPASPVGEHTINR